MNPAVPTLEVGLLKLIDQASVAALRWKLKKGDETVASGAQEQLNVQSGGVQELAGVDVSLPPALRAEQLTLTAELTDANGKTDNSWDLWRFPTNRLAEPSLKIRYSGYEALKKIIPSALERLTPTQIDNTDLLVTTRLDEDARGYLAAGGRVILLEPDPTFEVEKTNFRLSSWDGGGPSGTILDQAHPALRGMPSDGWCDLQFYSLIQGSKPVFLNAMPSKVRPLIRCIDRPTRLLDRAYLFEVAVGRGKLLVSGFNFARAIEVEDPAAIFLLDQLVRYGLGPEFLPKATLPVEALLREKAK